MTLSVAAIAALELLSRRRHHATIIYVGCVGDPPIQHEEAKELIRAGYATFDAGVVTITNEGRARLAREQEWKKP